MSSGSDQSFDHQQLHNMQAKLAKFLRFLMAQGFRIDIDTQTHTQQLLATNDFSNKAQFQLSLRTLLCKNPQQWQAFEELYTEFWLPKNRMSISKKSNQTTSKRQKKVEGTGDQHGGTSTHCNSDSQGLGSTAEALSSRASIGEDNEHIDFSFMDDEAQIERFSQSCKRLVKKLSRRFRKTVSSERGERLDLRKSIQRNLKNGGNLIELSWFNKPEVLPRITLLIDVSRSMSGYSNAFLLFALALVKELPGTRVFIFNTRLVDITTILRENHLDKVQQYLQLLNNAWGGGTRIAHSIHMLHRHGIPKKRSNHHLIIHSDGLDTDPADQLAMQLGRLQKQYRSIIWLSPLLNDNAYTVETAALKQAMSHINHFLPIHNLSCLNNLVDTLARPSIDIKTSKEATYG